MVIDGFLDESIFLNSESFLKSLKATIDNNSNSNEGTCCSDEMS